MGWRIAVLVGIGLVVVTTIPAAAPVGVSCLMSTSYTGKLIDAWIAEHAPAPVHQPTPTITPTLSPYMDVKAGEGPPPMGEERVTTEELARYVVALKGCDSVK
ncbi:hypothetical protein ACGFI3_22195 [Nonomuraea wenchangensis]|uniref:hypothetical protein n=1 Tax=Nonomuraea wenchangensis TaxID=568860 RepID=UPI003716684F